MKKKTYFLIFSFFIICLITNTSYASDNHIKENNLGNNQNMLISEISTSNNNLNNNIENLNKNINLNNKNNSINQIKSTNKENIATKVSTTTQKTKNTKPIKSKTSINPINSEQFYKNKYIEVELVDQNKKRITNTPVYMTLTYNKNTKTYKLGTNNKGIIKVEISLTGTYSVRFEFKGTEKYLASNSNKITVIKDLNLDSIKTSSKNLKKDIESNGKIPKTININGNNYTTEEFLYLMSKSIININKNDKSAIKIKYINKAPTPNSNELSGNIYKKEYLKLSNNIIKFMNTYSRAPNYVSSSLGKIPYNQIVHIYSKILDFYKSEKRLCNYVSIEKLSKFKKITPVNGISGSSYNLVYSILNDKYKNENLKKYLSSSINCQSTNTQIIKLAKSLTSSLKDSYLKSKTIFNYVRDKITYSNYNNTKKGAIKTLTQKSGNCVDQTHLLIAIARAAGIPARYVHGTNCKFSSGYVCGHVWAQLLIGNTWVVADPTSYRNSLGTVKNWNTNSYYLIGKTSYLSF